MKSFVSLTEVKPVAQKEKRLPYNIFDLHRSSMLNNNGMDHHGEYRLNGMKGVATPEDHLDSISLNGAKGKKSGAWHFGARDYVIWACFWILGLVIGLSSAYWGICTKRCESMQIQSQPPPPPPFMMGASAPPPQQPMLEFPQPGFMAVPPPLPLELMNNNQLNQPQPQLNMPPTMF